MSRKIDIFIADSSGNITIMVLTPTDRKDYTYVANKLLEIKELGGEQVAFVINDESGKPSRMEMCGLEFCGNASRAFALYSLCREYFSDNGDKPAPLGLTTINVSGCNKPLTAHISSFVANYGDTSAIRPKFTAAVSMEMPVPASARLLSETDLAASKGGLLVDIDGISHLILEDVAPAAETFDNIKNRIYEDIAPDMPAFGIMFCDTVNDLMTPVVYVKDVDTTYFEGSCASGTVAASFARSRSLSDGTYHYTIHQPDGILESTVVKKEGLTESITLEGPVTLTDIMTVEI